MIAVPPATVKRCMPGSFPSGWLALRSSGRVRCGRQCRRARADVAGMRGWISATPPSRYALQRTTFATARLTPPANRSGERSERLVKVGGEGGIRPARGFAATADLIVSAKPSRDSSHRIMMRAKADAEREGDWISHDRGALDARVGDSLAGRRDDSTELTFSSRFDCTPVTKTPRAESTAGRSSNYSRSKRGDSRSKIASVIRRMARNG
jgi:hypothetical protein